MLPSGRISDVRRTHARDDLQLRQEALMRSILHVSRSHLWKGIRQERLDVLQRN